MADLRSDRLTTCQSELKSVVSRRPSVYSSCNGMEVVEEQDIVSYLRDMSRGGDMLRHCSYRVHIMPKYSIIHE
jgi:hypothetical protein